MDEVIFEEFKGTGNMELHLDRSLVEKRLYPAIHILQSGTRREDLLYHPEEWERVQLLRKTMAALPPLEAMEQLINNLHATKSNAELLARGSPVIASDSQLAEILPRLRQFDRVAVDTEADSLHCYFEKLCLIQLTFDGEDILVDPLAPLDLQPLCTALAEREIVLQGMDFDLRLLRRIVRSSGARSFRHGDRCSHAGPAGIQPRGAGATIFRCDAGQGIAEGELGAPSASCDDGGLRQERYPLSSSRSRRKWRSRCRALGRMEWFRQSCQRALEQTLVSRERDPDDAWRIAGSGTLPPQTGAVLRAIWQWRDREAQTGRSTGVSHPAKQRHDRGGEAICRRRDAGFPALVGAPATRLCRSGTRGARVAGIGLAATAAAVESVRTPGFDKKVEELRRRRDHHAKELAIDPAFIAPRSALEGIAADPSRSETLLVQWQRDLLGL